MGIGGGGVNYNSGFGGAGGGGWYGGSGNVPDGSADDDRGGGGGSGFIWTSSTAGNVPSGYSVPTSKYLTDARLVAGNASMPNTAGTGNMTGKTGNGYAKITVLVTETITATNLELIPGIDEQNLDVIIPSNNYNTTIRHTYENIIWTSGIGEVTLQDGVNHQVVLMTSTGALKVYNIHPVLGKAKLQDVTITGQNVGFHKDIYSYDLSVANDVTSLSMTVTPESGVTYTIQGNDLKVGKNAVTIVASKTGSESTTYTFNVTRAFKSVATIVNSTYSYTGSYQTFTAPYTTDYKLEVWGAQGGYRTTAAMGGYGGYARGTVRLTAGQKIYIYVGQAGGNGSSGCGSTICAGGWNGGGYRYKYYGGGGATDMRLTSGSWNNASSLKSRIIVAGGGGSDGATGKKGMYGGGTVGGSSDENYTAIQDSCGIGGNQTYSGKGTATTITSQTTSGLTSNTLANYAGGFGFGGAGTSLSSGFGGAGGGGWYGGAGVIPDHSQDDDRGGGGGSGFVWTSANTGKVPSGYTPTSAYYLTNPSIVAGNASMPNTAGTGNMTGKTGHGYAKITYANQIDLDEVTALTVDKGTLSPEFNKDITSYTLNLGMNDTELNVGLTTSKGIALVTGTGKYTLEAGTKTIPVTVTNVDGVATVYNINVTRLSNPSAVIEGFKVNGTRYNDFDPTVFDYTIDVPLNTPKINLEIIKKYPGQRHTPTNTIYELPGSTRTETVMVFSEDDTSNQPYTFTFNRELSTKLKSLSIAGGTIVGDFDPNKTEYTLEMNENARELQVNAVSWFDDAVITVTEPRYVGLNDNTLTVTVELEGTAPTTYTFNISRISAPATDQVTGFNYTGNYQTYVAPYTGNYKLEVWGAQGGYRSSSSYGGKGGYAAGTLRLNQGQTLYVYVGKAGGNGTNGCGSTICAGGWNGGGYRYKYYGGGGATDIRLTSGAWNNATSLKSRFIVAGGGGSDGAANKTGMYGGGTTGGSSNDNYSQSALKNYTGKGGNQTYSGYGTGYTIASQTTTGLNANTTANYAGGFGFGGGGSYLSNGYGGAGGGGWYGGSGNIPDGSADDDRGGGGGSGFVWTSANASKVPSGYSVSSDFYLSTTKLVAGNASMPNHAGTGVMTGNTGNGYAKITAIAAVGGDAFLDSITLNDGDIPIENFETWTTNYAVTVSKYTYKLKIAAVPKDSTATIEGVGEFEIEPGTHDYNIVVTNGSSTKTYTVTVTRDPSDDPSPTNIIINNSQAHLCGYDPERLCIYTFNPTTTVYDVVLPFQTTTISLKTELRSSYQRVKYFKVVTTTNEDGEEETTRTEIATTGTEINVTLGDTISIYEVEVTPEDGSAPRVYTYNLERDLRGNNNLENLTVTSPETDINFATNTYEYAFSIPSSADELTITYQPQNVEASTRITGDLTFDITEPEETGPFTATAPVEGPGMHDVYIIVTAPNGNSKTYILHVYKEMNTNTFLSSITVTDDKSENVELSPYFSKFITDYTAEVPNTTNSVTINAEAEASNFTIRGNGETNETNTFTLNSGRNTVEITVVSESGDTEIYTITIIKAKNNNSKLSDIVVEQYREEGAEVVSYTLSPEFDGDTLTYTLEEEIPKDLTRLNVIATPEASTTTYTVRGNNTLNKKSNTIIITAVAEDKTFTTYEIVVNKNVSTDNFLENIVVKNGETVLPLNEEFDTTKTDETRTEYTLNVDSTVSSISLTGVVNPEKRSTVTGGGIHSLAKGSNTLRLTVTSEAGEARIYTVTITRATDNNVNLLRVTNNQGSTVTTAPEGETDYDYLINVQYKINTIEITGIAESATSRVTGNGIKYLNVGNNDYILTVKSEAGTSANYKVRVVRDQSDNDDLSFLYVQEGGLSPAFNETTLIYEVKVPNAIDNLNKLHIEVITEDENATYEILYNNAAITDTPLEVDEGKEVIVRVTAQDGINTKEYKLEIIRQREIPADENLSLSSLTTDQGNVSPTLTEGVLNYTLTVENEVSEINVSAVAADAESVETIQGIGRHSLKEGKNAITVFVIGKSGVQRDYQIIVTRKLSNDASLSSLVVKGKALSPKFESEVTTYEVTTSNSYLEFTTIRPTHPDATYVVSGNEGITSGNTKEITITVTAADGETTMVYKINATGEPSANNNLASLAVEGYTLTPVFHKGVTFYATSVGNDVNSIVITATAEDENATIEGTGLKPVNSGENTFQVIVTSQAGTQKTYTVLVAKDASTNNYLASLEVSEEGLTPAFNKEVTSYTMSVPYTVDSITFTGIPEDANAFVAGNGDHTLVEGENTITIMVTSEDGDVRPYTIIVTRAPVVSAKLTSLSISGYSLDRDFNKEINDYYISVSSEVTGLDILTQAEGSTAPILSYTTEDAGATVEVHGNSGFTLGMNTVDVVVTSSDGNLTNTYKLYINRQMSTNNFLNTLYTSVGTLNPYFDPNTLEYRIEVDRDVEQIEVFAEAEDSLATISEGLGIHDLELGENVINVKVKSSMGIARTYKLRVTRKKDDNKNLASLSLSNLTSTVPLAPAFNKDVIEYNITVNNDVSYLMIEATAESEFAEVTGDGIKEIRSGTNTFVITVTAEDATTKTYTINVTKNVSTNNYLSALIPSVGEFEEEFDKDRTNYTLHLEYTVNELSFTATPESNLATITGHELKIVSDGESYRNIKVTAEDGISEKVYTVKVIKESASEAKLQTLHVDGYDFDFNPDTFVYNISVSRSKEVLMESELTALPKDEEATVNLMGDLTLSKEGISIYVVEVIARDGYTTQEYRINITRDNEELTLRLESDYYTIVRKDDEELREQGYKLTADDYVIGIRPSTNLQTFLNRFDNDQEDLAVYTIESERLEDVNQFVGTAMVIRLEKNNYVYDSLVIVVRGDLNKDGKVNLIDQTIIKQFVSRLSTLDT
ncbi:MAG: cadherin-like beta sandwich domain-containing protein, partial [Bacilli bacterium]|nr:cadherin-like beta sandwich domain-containing protein [Bacilli bacterium]